jgi:formate hydrogenlyase transcriptional activator
MGRLTMFDQTAEWKRITEWSGVLQGFSEPEQLLATFISASNLGLAIVDTQLKFQAINKALADMNGVPAEAHLGKSVRDILGNAAEHIEPNFHRVLLTGQPVLNVALTLQLPTRMEVGHWIEHYFPLNDDSGKVARVGVVVVEVTEQKKSDPLVRELQRKNERLKLLLDISTALNLTPDLRQAFPSIAASIRGAMPCDLVDLSILEDSFQSIRLYLVDPACDPALLCSDVSILLRDAVCGEAVIERQPRVVSRADLTAIHSPFLQMGIQSACCVPFVTPEGVIGSFNVASTRENGFLTEDVELLKQIGMQMSNVLDRTLECDEIKSKRGSPERAPVNVITETGDELNFGEIIGESSLLRRVLDQAKTVAPSDATVLILGETGTGKELIARAIHHMSRRKDANFVKLNCAAIPSGLLESELFGHEKGAFTGALTSKVGRLELADHGTLFLDEIGDLPLELQPKLLRVLQDQEFERLGSNRAIHVNIRLLAATNQDLAMSIVQRRFRADLFYRLNVFPIRLPPLRERADDIQLLINYFIQKYARKMNKTIDAIPAETMAALKGWDWPGNIRELENFIERSVILCEGNVFNAPIEDLRPFPQKPAVMSEGVRREHVLRALRETNGLIDGPQGAAAKLSMAPGTLRSIMQRMKILPRNYQN